MIWLGVSGAHRSGTTILARTLNQHPEIGVFVEYGLEKYVRAVDSIFNRTDEIESYDNCVSAMKEDSAKKSNKYKYNNKNKNDKLTNEATKFYRSRDEALELSSKGPFRPVRENHGDKMLLSAYQMVFPRRKLRVVGDKMPHFGDKNDVLWLKDRLPNFKLLHIVRNPLDVMNSSLARRNKMRAGEDIWHVETVQQSADEWVREWNWALVAKRQLGDAMLIVKYEDMARDPETTLAQIADFLDLSSPLPSTFQPLPNDLKLYAMSEKEKLEAMGWFAAVSEVWSDLPLTKLIERFPFLPLVAMPAEPITFHRGGNSQAFIAGGFYDPEPEGTWAMGDTAELRGNFGLREGRCTITLCLRAISYCERVHVWINGAKVGTVEIESPSWEERSYAIDFSHPPADGLGTSIRLEIDRPKRPDENPIDDVRALGAFLRSVVLHQ